MCYLLGLQEVNEVVQKVSGSDQPVPILFDEALFSHSERTSKPLLYSFLFRLKVVILSAICLVLIRYQSLCCVNKHQTRFTAVIPGQPR